MRLVDAPNQSVEVINEVARENFNGDSLAKMHDSGIMGGRICVALDCLLTDGECFRESEDGVAKGCGVGILTILDESGLEIVK